MTTELEQEFFKVFEIEPKIEKYCYWECKKPELKDVACESPCNFNKTNIFYPEITDRKLLQLLCIYNDIQSCVELCITPCKYENTKEVILQFLIDEKTNITNYEEGTYMDVMTKQIQQLFKEEE